MQEYISANIHNFKTHLSKYIRDLEDNKASAIIINRNGRPATLLIPYKKPQD
jgi:antitoxin (DNA-binding transcriptional repressor) of toxin-antitoxin stability system